MGKPKQQKKSTQTSMQQPVSYRPDNYMSVGRARSHYRKAKRSEATNATSFRGWVRAWHFGNATLAPKLQKMRTATA